MASTISEFESAISRFERQAAESIHEKTDLLTVGHELDVSEAAVYTADDDADITRNDRVAIRL